MAKALFIAEKPSVAREFAKALHMDMRSYNGYKEGEQAVVTWCVGHLVTMSYPDAYDIKYKRWSLSTLPFIPQARLVTNPESENFGWLPMCIMTDEPVP